MGSCKRALKVRELAAQIEFVSSEAGIFTGLAEEGKDTDQDLNREKKYPDVHALKEASGEPRPLQVQVVDSAKCCCL